MGESVAGCGTVGGTGEVRSELTRGRPAARHYIKRAPTGGAPVGLTHTKRSDVPLPCSEGAASRYYTQLLF